MSCDIFEHVSHFCIGSHMEYGMWQLNRNGMFYKTNYASIRTAIQTNAIRVGNASGIFN